MYGINPYNSMANNPISFNDPNGDVLPAIAIAAIVGGAIGGAANVISHWDDITAGGGFNLGAAAGAFGIGAAGGALAGAASVGAIGAGAIAGFGVGAVSGMAGDMVTQVGNALAFGDQYSVGQNLAAGALGGIFGGIQGFKTAGPNVNPWTGVKTPPSEVASLSAADLYARYGSAANNLVLADGALPAGARYGATELGSNHWNFFNSLDELDGFVSGGQSGGWLGFHEGVGHTIARHVGKTDAQLIARLNSSSRISGASTFTNQATAEAVISSTIRGNRANLNAWLRSGSSRNLVLDYTGNSIIGRGIMRGQSAVTNLTNARVVLKPNGNGGFNILTAFTR